MNKIISKFFRLFDISIAIYLFIVLGYSVITGNEMSKMIDVDWWILLFVLCLNIERSFCQCEEEKTEQE